MIWLDIPAHPGYKASPEGEIMDLTGDDGYRILVPTLNKRTGYLQVCLLLQGKEVIRAVHVLVGRTYLGTHPDGLQVCHRDPTQKTNNHLGNLGFGAEVLKLHHEAARDRCDQGHPFTPENTMRRLSRGREIRKCRKCHAVTTARYRAKKRA